MRYVPQQLTHPVGAAMSLGVFLTLICPGSIGRAQLPTFEQLQPQPPPASLAQSQAEYTLGGGDRIRLDILEVPQYSGEYQIPPGGSLTLPLIGSVSLEGLTEQQAAQVISARYQSVIKRPLVTVTLLSPRPFNVSVSGEVNRPGSYTLSFTGGVGDNPGIQYPSVTQAIQQAGGVTLSADLRNVQVRRRQQFGSGAVTKVNLWEFVQTGNPRQNLLLRDGDTVFVPILTNLNLAEARQIATSSLASDPEEPLTIAVVGQVNRPGTYTIVGGNTGTDGRTLGLPTISRAIQRAGGIKPIADIRQISVRRVTKTGAEYTISVNLWQLLQMGDFKQDTVLQEGDTIIVPTASDVNPAEATELATASFSPDTIQVSVVGEVTRPGLVEVPPNTPLNQALLAAGGFDHKRARKSSVELIRLNPDGTVSKQTIPIDFAQGINEQSNPILRDNDIVVVNRSGVARIADTLETPLSTFGGVFNVFRLFEFLGGFF
ncbi:polysaccharide biosynthesis/export family protein [Coleofasciculus sp. E2-BRE-01]|uniref:polysaccharide biosynthesis/export family protein n=1 Tax=Coleofasciculus sp. E2-BRE-01 TaxID=3069524 RepID=UPI0032FA7B0A